MLGGAGRTASGPTDADGGDAVEDDLAGVVAESAGAYDAIVIGCASDPCVEELRERVAVLTPAPHSEVAWLRGRPRAYGLSGVVRHVRSIDAGVAGSPRQLAEELCA